MSRSAHIIWPAAIIGLLLLSGLTTAAIFWASRSDGGAQIVDDYYRKSVAWDSIAAVRDQSNLLGWTAAVAIRVEENDRFGLVTVVDSDGLPVEGLTGVAIISRPQTSSAYGSHALEPAGTPGSYRFDFPYTTRGLWDIDLQTEKSEHQFARMIRVEI
jgi:nitrogen fixation protein FixH